MAIDKTRMMFDRRTLIRHMRAGRVTEAEYAEFVTNLRDVEDNIRDPEDGGDEDGYERRTTTPEAPVSESAPVAAPMAPEAPPAPTPPVVPQAPSVPSIDISAPPPPPVPPLGHKS